MILTGLHAAQQEAALRGSRVLCSGVPGPSSISAQFLDRSFHSPYSGIGLRIEGAAGADVRPGFKGYQGVPFDGAIAGWSLLADQAGWITFDIYRSSVATNPPRAKDTIVSLAAWRPMLQAQQAMMDQTLFGWRTDLTKGDVLGFEVLAASGIKTVTLTLLISVPRRP